MYVIFSAMRALTTQFPPNGGTKFRQMGERISAKWGILFFFSVSFVNRQYNKPIRFEYLTRGKLKNGLYLRVSYIFGDNFRVLY